VVTTIHQRTEAPSSQTVTLTGFSLQDIAENKHRNSAAVTRTRNEAFIISDAPFFGFVSRSEVVSEYTTGWTVQIQIPVSVEPHQASYSMVVLSRGAKRPKGDDNHSTRPSSEAKNGWSSTSTPPAYLHGADRDIFVSAFISRFHKIKIVNFGDRCFCLLRTVLY
jgi:hypothetical protein